MLYWFFVKVFGPIARHHLGPTVSGLNNVPRTGGAIIAANHLAVIDDALIPITCPRMVHFMGKAEYFEGKGIKGKFKKWWFTSVGVFPVDRSGGNKSLGALEHAREIIEDGHLFGIHIEGTRSPDGRMYKGHTGVARLALETGCPIVPVALIGSDKLQPIGTTIPKKGKTQVKYGKPIEVSRKAADEITHAELRELTDRVSAAIREMSGQEYVDEYAQKVKAELKAAKEAQKAGEGVRKATNLTPRSA
ncbi:1-acyl-sn-glycerol-3-phosphate acyltransferase [Bifidobacterium reuteri]|uniref:Acyltransferase n=2 Tax=Bifidobacterium reuteri TaxID=983706 RepID=A0A087CSU5_9BIFI|nr:MULTISPECIES: lysophospholipid acyltransferase family protein [Bifidobacterium]KAA8826073.1 1-acyl-sn-glycerol-3-phosphate acyltransferase [Bifidobacterium reuteri]KFI86345.1 acyltransferase [Bifidobacterium reuteri DSM 23975]TPF78136.1 acyl-phosphate glycerol 3-phosphate acyltransferase [Bifidobacterium sp. UTCIF-1]TPF81095.1 acyl-phosphate glycerol 3-phosphate acyltransferase [Bifidobacterium sp. UTCIF-24]TPF82100.1 acyl-phosphate glycerol 3-phosphate acyltransferase [Bifidobacterium sp. 